MNPANIDDLIDNWAAWSRSRPHGGHCCSFEHHYRPPQHWHPEAPRIGIDILSALRVEHAVRVVPAQHKGALILHYVWRSPSAYICRKLALRPAAWDQFLHDSRLMLQNILRRQEKQRISKVTIRYQLTC